MDKIAFWSRRLRSLWKTRVRIPRAWCTNGMEDLQGQIFCTVRTYEIEAKATLIFLDSKFFSSLFLFSSRCQKNYLWIYCVIWLFHTYFFVLLFNSLNGLDTVTYTKRGFLHIFLRQSLHSYLHLVDKNTTLNYSINVNWDFRIFPVFESGFLYDVCDRIQLDRRCLL